MEPARPCLHVCVTCHQGERADGDPPDGQILYNRLAAMAGEDAAITVRPVVCLAHCERGCAAAIQQPGKWGYLLGGLTLEHAADLIEYGAAYAAHERGTVLPSRRPASLRAVIDGRIPAWDATPAAPTPASLESVA